MQRSTTSRLHPFSLDQLILLILPLLLFLAVTSEARNLHSTELECNPHQVKMRCIMGCFGCFKAFGVEMYDMAACCRDCRLSDADVIDDGPRQCSPSYIKTSWLKRFG